MGPLGPCARVVGSIAFGVLLFASSATAAAQPSALDRWDARAGAVVATSAAFASGASLGFGRVFGAGAYAGALGDFWFPSAGGATVAAGGRVSGRASAFDALAVVGYDWEVSDQVVLRPFGGGGVLVADASACVAAVGSAGPECVEVNDTSAAAAFGLEGFVLVAPVEIGGEVRALLAQSSGTGIVGAHVGVAF